MTTFQQFMKTVFALLQQRLVSLGFRKRQHHIFSLSVSEDVLGLVGLNKATSGRGPGVLEINPVIGVQNRRVGQLVAELAGEKFEETSPFLAQANVGYLSPAAKYQPFLFTETEPVDELADQLVEAVKVYGLPFVRSNEPLPALLHTMRSTRFASPENTVYGIPVALHLLGRNSEADAFLNDELAKLGSQTDAGSQYFRDFASRLRERMLTSSSSLLVRKE
jgi:hypothetical protein